MKHRLGQYRFKRAQQGAWIAILLFCCFLMLTTELAAAASGGKQARASGKGVSGSDPLQIPVRAKACVIEDETNAVAPIKSRTYSEIRARFYSSIVSFAVKRGDRVKKGQLIARTNTDMLSKMQGIYQDYVRFYETQAKIAANNLDLAQARRDRLSGLAAKGIVPRSELEQAENMVVSANDFLNRIIRGKDGMAKSLAEYTEQIRLSDFYSDIDGVVTSLIVDPRSLAGNLTVMPGTLVAKVEQPGAYIAEAVLTDSQVHGVREGMPADVTLPDGTRIEGKVSFVSTLPAAEKAPESPYGGMGGYGATEGAKKSLVTYKAVVDFTRGGEILPPGLMASVRVVTAETSVSSCLPWNAIEIIDGRAFARTFKEGSGWARTPIRVGKRGRYDVEVLPAMSESLIVRSRLW